MFFFCSCCRSHFAFHKGWTLTTKLLLKHLKILYHSLSFTSLSVIHYFSWCENTLCVCVCVCMCVCGVFVSLLYESCKMANIHLHYKVSFFSPTITFGFLSFFTFPSSVVLIPTFLKAVIVARLVGLFCLFVFCSSSL